MRGLEIALPQRVLALQHRYRVHGVGAADRPLARFREAEEAHLSLAYHVGHRADDILDWHGRVDAMLIEEIDVVCPQATERAEPSTASRMCAGRLSTPAMTPFVSKEEAELGGDDDAAITPDVAVPRAHGPAAPRSCSARYASAASRGTCIRAQRLEKSSQSIRARRVLRECHMTGSIPINPSPMAETVRPWVPSVCGSAACAGLC